MIETLRPGAHARNAKVVLFDFDGTLSLIRSGWVDVMVPMMVGILRDLKSGESEPELRAVVEDYVARLTGKETIYQMMEFAAQIEKRGGRAEDPKVYKKMYLDLLWEVIKDRIAALESGKASPERYLVPGSRQLLEALKARGLTLYLASGTDDEFVKNEARLLEIDQYFDGVYGALDDLKSFSKAILIRRIIDSAAYSGPEFLGFGDGYVEIENVKEVGGVAVGIASKEPECLEIDTWKRDRLAKVGADWMVPNYLAHDRLMSALFA
ncbi:MAG: HAD family hydrolase [Bryobacteraceae bacterium]|nr:HAD family hydrolase [Bryobacteraceae bacterium]